jgi:hypothetical protein
VTDRGCIQAVHRTPSSLSPCHVQCEVEVSDRAGAGHVRVILFPRRGELSVLNVTRPSAGVVSSEERRYRQPLTMAHSKSSKKTDTKSKRVKDESAAKDGQLDSPFLHVNTEIRLSIPPVFATDLQRGAMEMLDSLVMR